MGFLIVRFIQLQKGKGNNNRSLCMDKILGIHTNIAPGDFANIA
jgi:hypothetical protein